MPPLLSARGLAKRYGQVEALQGADFDVDAGEVVALIGDNGAGKSTMVRMLSGSEQPDTGSIAFDGRTVALSTPIEARRLGIETVFQDLALAPHLDPIQNLYLGREVMRKGLLGRLGFMDTRAMRAAGEKSFASLGSAVRDYSGRIGGMSGGQKQSIAVARAAAWASKVIFLDEPTAALGVVQTQGVLDLIRRVRDEGIGVVFISHSMPHVLEVADRVQVMRQGRRVVTYRGSDTSVEELVGAMTGALDAKEPGPGAGGAGSSTAPTGTPTSTGAAA